jgi:HAE1 family hydrophobic/amphiphilic exporter-1
MISAVVVLIGLISLSKLPVDLMPDTNLPAVTVQVTYDGVGPLEIEELITRPIEQAVSAVAGLESLESTSSEGRSNVRLAFVWGTDINEAVDDVRNRIDRVRGRMPEDATPPTVFKFDSTAMPIMGIGVKGDFDPVALRELAEHSLSQRLERVAGVAAVTVGGGLRRQVHINLSKEKITALNLSVDRIINLLRTENQNIPAGEVSEGDSTYLVRSQGQFTSLDDIRNLVVLTKDGTVPVYLRDIADVVDATEDRRSAMRINGTPGVRLQIQKQSGGNTVEVAAGVRAEVERINREVPGVQLAVLDDSSKFIARAINNVKEHAIVGGILVILIIFLFLRDVRSTLIVSTSIPVSVIGTFALLYFSGFTLNTMTFGGLALGIGMIVDAAIVVLENTFRHMEMGKDRMTASLDASEEVWSAILASTLTHIAVFVPLLFLSGISSVMFKQLSVVVIFSLAMSLFVAVTIVPVLCSRVLHLPQEARHRRGLFAGLYRASERFLNGMDDRYRRVIEWALHHRPTVIGASTAMLVVAIALLPRIGSELVPQADEGEVNVTAELPIGTRFERTEPMMVRLEGMIKEAVPEVETVITNIGGGGFGPFGNVQSHRGQFNLRLVPREQRQRSNDRIAMDLRRQLSGIPGVIVRANPAGGNFQMGRMFGGGGDSRLSVEIRGHDLKSARQVAQDTFKVLQSTPGIADARLGQNDGRPEVGLRIDRAKAALLGMTVTGVANTIRTNVAGTQAALFHVQGNEYPIVVRLRQEDRSSVPDVADVLVSGAGGRVVPAKNLLAIDRGTGPVSIDRKNQERIQRVNAETEIPLSDAVKAVQERLPQLRLPEDFSVGFGAEVEQQARAFSELQLMLMLAILLVYAVMASQYESLRDPFIIMFSIPVSAFGVVVMLLATGTSFSLQAYIGIIMLAGIVVSNAILLVDYTNTLRTRDKLPLREAVALAGRTRLRPILMTSLATGLGLVPMALGVGDGAELQAPLARVVIGGLTASTLVTLVLVPAVYTLSEEGWAWLWKKNGGPPVESAL